MGFESNSTLQTSFRRRHFFKNAGEEYQCQFLGPANWNDFGHSSKSNGTPSVLNILKETARERAPDAKVKRERWAQLETEQKVMNVFAIPSYTLHYTACGSEQVGVVEWFQK